MRSVVERRDGGIFAAALSQWDRCMYFQEEIDIEEGERYNRYIMGSMEWLRPEKSVWLVCIPEGQQGGLMAENGNAAHCAWGGRHKDRTTIHHFVRKVLGMTMVVIEFASA